MATERGVIVVVTIMNHMHFVIVVQNPEKKDHKKPDPQTAHGLCLAQPSVVFLCGGTGASKTTTALSLAVRGYELEPWTEIFLMSPSLESAIGGEYRLLNVTPLKEWPQIDYWKKRPGKKLLICDDVDLTHLSTRGNPSQRELADRCLGYVSTHMNLTVYIMNQNWVGCPPFARTG